MSTTTGRDFVVPRDRIAAAPPERRGIARDQVHLLVAGVDGTSHVRFTDLPEFTTPGDLLVVNTSATRPAAIDATWRGRPVLIHLSTEYGSGCWVVEIRVADGSGPMLDGESGDVCLLEGGGSVQLLHPESERVGPTRLWKALVTVPDGGVHGYMAAHGRPITYGPHTARWPLEAYQTVFAKHAGSAEMASAARPFSVRLVTELVTRGLTIAPITLHAGVSSPEAHEPPNREWFEVPDPTAALVRHTRLRGGRVIAVGTTVTRALETVATEDGRVEPGSGWTDLVLGPHRPARVVDGLITGWHEADASHLHLLDAVAGPALVDAAYEEALSGPYLWHEFGDSVLLQADFRSG